MSATGRMWRHNWKLDFSLVRFATHSGSVQLGRLGWSRATRSPIRACEFLRTRFKRLPHLIHTYSVLDSHNISLSKTAPDTAYSSVPQQG
jgi:hypothetical protein